MPYTQPRLRPAMKGQTLDWIASGKCWHFDCWLFDTSQPGELAFLVQTRRGGREMLVTSMYVLGPLGFIAVDPASVRIGRELTLASLSAAERARVDAAHWRELFPRSLNVPNGFTRRSVRFWYVPVPALDPLDGLTNLYASTGRAQRDAKLAQRD